MRVARDMEQELEGTLVNTDMNAFRARMGHSLWNQATRVGLTQKALMDPARPIRLSPIIT